MKNTGSRFLLILVVIALAVWAFVTGGLRFGLDLKGGASLTYDVEFEEHEGQALDRDESMRRLIDVMAGRLNSSGVGGISIIPYGDNEGIVVEIPGRGKSQIDDIRRVLEQQGTLEFRILADQETTIDEDQKRKDREALGLDLQPDDKNLRWYPSTEGSHFGGEWVLVKVPEGGLREEVRRLRRERGLVAPTAASHPEMDPIERARLGREYEEKAAADPEIREKMRELADMERRELFTGEDLETTRVERQIAELAVYFQFKPDRQADFKAFTERSHKKLMAIILDGKVDTAPSINEPLPGKGIITGGGSGFTAKEAAELVTVLDSGSTGATLELEREEVLGPGLGQDAIDRGRLSILIGFGLVLLVMLWLYRVPGIVANVALLLNVLLLLGALALFRASLTLAGIAGIVLTLGMAVDANILIFERIKEERARGKSLLESLAAGYDRALVAIVDANVTTVLTAIVLIVVGTGTVRGFGVTLTIGILASMFTAIYVTRTIFEWGIDKGLFKNLSFGPERTPFAFDFMAKRRIFTMASIVAMIAGFLFFLSRPEQESKDLEFIGGAQCIVQLDEPLDAATVRERVSAGDYETIKVQRLEPRGITVDDAEVSNRWQVRTPVLPDAGDDTVDERDPGELFMEHVRTELGASLVRGSFEKFGLQPGNAFSIQVNTFGLPEGMTADGFAAVLSDSEKLADVAVKPVEGDANALLVTGTAENPSAIGVGDAIQDALRAAPDPVFLSDPIPSATYLNPSRAQQLWRAALQAVLIAMLLQVMYIRLRFADFKHGFAAVCALVHDVTIALGTVAVCDALGLVTAKINLVLVAAFLTLIGYSMNDTIVVFDRIRENLGRSKVVRTASVNTAINQTLARSIRTSITTLAVVLVQFVLNLRTGSVLEGFAFVMVIGVISGTYSSIFIAGPLLLFIPDFWRRFSSNRKRMWLQIIATVVGGVLWVRADEFGWQSAVDVLLLMNIPLYFLFHFVPWLTRENPDELLVEEIEAESKARPLHKPGI